jgi:hypothetical protein
MESVHQRPPSPSHLHTGSTTSGRYDNLPGLPFPAAPDTYPGKDDVASYLQAYAAKFGLPVRLGTRVTSLIRSGGGYVADRPPVNR